MMKISLLNGCMTNHLVWDCIYPHEVKSLLTVDWLLGLEYRYCVCIYAIITYEKQSIVKIYEDLTIEL